MITSLCSRGSLLLVLLSLPVLVIFYSGSFIPPSVPSPPSVSRVPPSMKRTRFVCVSDTHGIHSHPSLLKVPDGDVLLFAGDAGIEDAVGAQSFNAWLEKQPHAFKVVTFGNMDFWAEKISNEQRRQSLPAATHILVDEIADVAGFRIFGSPFTPKFYGSFQLQGEDAGTHWKNALPPDSDVDILLTHGPPRGYGDVTRGRHVGDPALLQAAQELRKKPSLWVAGHIHASYGEYQLPHPLGAISLYNAATNDLRSGSNTQPWVVDL